MQVLNVKLDCRTIGRLAHPCIKVFAFASFEEKDIIAIVQFGNFVKLEQLAFGVKLRFFATMWKEGIEVIQEMSMPWIFCQHIVKEMHFFIEMLYRKVTPLVVNISTRCRFSLATPLAFGSSFLVFDMDKAL